jgi:hypothetical protein
MTNSKSTIIKKVKNEITIEEIPENQVSNRILYIRGTNKSENLFPLNMEILVVNDKKGFKKQGKYFGVKMNEKRDAMIYTFSFNGKITEFKTKFSNKKEEIKDYKFYIDTKSYKNKKQKNFHCNLLEGQKFNFLGFKGKMTKDDVEKECVNFYKDQKIKFTDKNKKLIESEKKQRDKQLDSMKKTFNKEIKKIKKESTKKPVKKSISTKKPVKKTTKK